MTVIKKKGLKRKIKLRFVGISQANQAGLEKAPRWAKIWSKSFQYKTCLDFVILSLSLSLIYISYRYRNLAERAGLDKVF